KNKERIYFVDPETGKLAALKDNTIMGKLGEKDDGNYVKREFDAPKTQVMGIVINGVLKGDLNWSMIAIGALVAVMLELCGVSALAFAVGVYVPIQYSTPIFLGGIVRWGVDHYLARQAAAVAVAKPLPEAAADAARAQLGLEGKTLNEREAKEVKELADEIADLSKNEPYAWVKVPAGTTLKMPEGQPDYEAKSDTMLKDVAR